MVGTVIELYCNQCYFFLSLCSLPEIMKEIEKEDEEKERRHTRRVIAKQERLKAAPPRIGKPK